MSTGAEIMVALNTLNTLHTNLMHVAWGKVHLEYTQREQARQHFSLGGGGERRHYWAKKLKAPGKHQKSLEYMGNHRKQVKILENSGTFF